MSKVIVFHPIHQTMQEVSDDRASKLADEGWVQNPRLVAIFNPSHQMHKTILEADLPMWEAKGYYAHPTVVYHPKEGQKMVSREQAQNMMADGWYDTPAKFPGSYDGVELHTKNRKSAA